MTDKQWDDYVERAKKQVKRLKTACMDIAKLAIKACDIHWGGGDHWDKHSNVYTLTRFAEEIGISYKTLHTYVSMTRKVYDKLTPKQQKDFNTGVGRNVMPDVTMKTPAFEVQARYDVLSRKGSGPCFLNEFVRRAKTAHHFFFKKANYEKLEQGELLEIWEYCNEIAQKIEEHLKPISEIRDGKQAKLRAMV